MIALLERRFPQSAHRSTLRSELIGAYAAYGDDVAVVERGRNFLTMFPNDPRRVRVAMMVADALARQNMVPEEFALYDRMLRELAAGAGNVPIGSKTATRENGPGAARSPEYAQVLDRYLARLAAENRTMDALRVYRREIDRNPNDPGLYERLAVFLEQHRMSAQVEETYRRALAQFQDRNWYDKLARWYLRTKQTAAFEQITREVVGVFSGTALEQYFNGIVSQVAPDAVLYRQLNLYAHQRFPDDLVFVKNLMAAYSRKETYNASASAALVREYWYYDPELRTRYFETLSREGRLDAEISAVRQSNPGIASSRYARAMAANPAAVEFIAEAEAWLSHFELAAPAERALAEAFPGRRSTTGRASALYRSLAAYHPAATEIAARLAEQEYRSEPRDAETLAKIGDVYADHGEFARARTFWNRMPQVARGKPESYLDAATVFWDYYLFNDALRLIGEARKKFDDAHLYAYQAGAIYEAEREYARAIHEYLEGAVAGDEPSKSRLLRLATRPETRALLDQATSAAVNADWRTAAVRAAVLEKQQRRQDLQAFLRARVAAEKSVAALADIRTMAERLGFDSIEEQSLEREIAMTNDPVDRMQLSLALARLYESKSDTAAGARTVDALYQKHPSILGVVRGAVNYHVRNGQRDSAIAILLDAAGRARPDLSKQFTLEAARIATEAGEFARARQLVTTLLQADPYRAEYLTAMAETYLRAHDDAGFRDYVLASIQELKTSPLAAGERVARIATLRRSLIPALTRLGDYAAALDQYIQVINAYPDDESTTKEAASYAVAHAQTDRLDRVLSEDDCRLSARLSMADCSRTHRDPR